MSGRISTVLRWTVRAGCASLVVAMFGSVGAQQTTPQISAPGYSAPVQVDTAGLPGPVQPIFFRHDIHAGQYQIDCRYCHFAVEVSTSPGIPSMATCMGCHMIVVPTNPEVQKLRQANADQKPVEWQQVYSLPPFVHFPHMRHVKANVDCTVCHGEVARMPRVYQVGSLKMGWCLDCHTERKVTTDCTACHY